MPRISGTSTKKAIQQRMDRATSYAKWVELACQHDEVTGMDRWRDREASDDYDYYEISMRLQRLQQLLGRRDSHGLLFTLNEGIHGNMGGMGNPVLYTHAKFGTKQLIKDYIDTLSESIEFIVDENNDEISADEKLDFLQRASHCFGRSALMLSGAGNLGMFHIGVIKALRETDTLPHIISGSSAGAMMAACLGTHTEEQLDQYFSTHHIAQIFGGIASSHDGQSNSIANSLLYGGNGPMDLEYLEHALDNLVENMTFAEAFELTGREINISISPQERHQSPRLLNAITSPNVMIRSAVRASCAIPGVFHATTLEAKSATGDCIPYLPSRKWVDGSVVGDLPAKRLARLYGVNHFIVSQANPLVLWAINESNVQQGQLSANIMSFIARAAKEGFNSSYRFTEKQLRRFPAASYMANTLHSVLNQSYTGDINICPDFRFVDPRILLKRISDKESAALIQNGIKATWPKIEMIKNCMQLSCLLDESLARYCTDVNEPLLPRSKRNQQQKKSRRAA